MISDQTAAHKVGAHWQEECEGYIIAPSSTPTSTRPSRGIPNVPQGRG